tara:strand:- start:412 stop:849 length:438 start_codon:yes stop_codon:yes gene_type:complete
MLMHNILKISILFFTLIFLNSESFAKTFEIEMRTQLGDERRVFSQKVSNIDINDTIIWKAVDKGHNIEFVSIPEGAEMLKSKKSEDVKFKFTIPGVYLYQCSPHKTIGMIGLIIVGNDKSNLNKVKEVKMFGLSKDIFETLLQDL